MGLEQKINYQLNKFPKVKKIIKRIYQRTMYTLSHKIKSEGNIERISPDDKEHEYFFGYYDKSPWDMSDRYILCMKANDTWSDVSPKEQADIIIIDTTKEENDPRRIVKIAETRAWNVQQACMLQWLGPNYNKQVLYNDYRDGKYCAVILDIDLEDEIKVVNERIINAPVYSVSPDAKTALTLDFSRLYNLRPGYGYYNVKEKTEGINLPDATAIWEIDIDSGKIQPLLKYSDFASFNPRKEMLEDDTVHKVNHIMISPNGKRFMVLYRWFNGQRKYTRLITCNIDGTDMYVLSDDDMVSHCYWKNDSEILAFENKKESGPGYYLMKDKTQEFIHCWPQFSNDGHPSYSPDRKLIVTDSYPNRARVAQINVMDGDETKKENTCIAKVYAPFKYDNDTRCDLHPRWNHKGDEICFDSVFEGHRGLYSIKNLKSANSNTVNIKEEIIKENIDETPKYTIITPMYNSFKFMKNYLDSFEKQTFRNFEIIIIDDCSTDGSYEKMCEYQKKSLLKIKILRTSRNGGPGIARNFGINSATGKWITFVDNDDWVDVKLLEKINRVIEKNDINCVIYNYYITDGIKNTITKSMYKGKEGIINVSECIKYLRNHSVCKFYKKEILVKNNIYYPTIKKCEDVGFVDIAVEACKKIYYFDEALYYYYQRTNSLSNTKNLNEKYMIEAFEILEKKLNDNYKEELKEKSVTDLLYGVVLMMCKSKKENKKIKEYISDYTDKYPNWYKCEIINYVGKAKKIFLIAIRYKLITVLKIMTWIHSRKAG